MLEYAHFLYVYIIFGDSPCFFLQGEINCWEERDRNISAPVSALYISFGSQGWTALFYVVDTAWPKV